jgi:shikimate dehydrogenase
MENVILIGMPGSGKSTVGKLLAEKMGREFVDADSQIVAYAGITIPEIFTQCGEEGFRQIETQVLSELGKKSGLVIATGGGCVTRPENAPLLRQNGTIFWLTRNLGKLPTDGRPLSQSSKLETMYQVRKPLYEAFADYIIDNDGPLQETLDQILRIREGNS